MVQNTMRASPGSFSGGRSTIAEKSQRSRGSMGVVIDWRSIALSPMIGPRAATIHCAACVGCGATSLRPAGERRAAMLPQNVGGGAGMEPAERSALAAAEDHSSWGHEARARTAITPRATLLLAAAGRAVVSAERIPLVLTVAIFTLAFLLPAWPWLSGKVTIPWDAKSQFFPQAQFLASSLARGEWPWWSPNVFAGWAQISDPQSLLFSPLHILLAAWNAGISLRGFDAVTFAYLFLGGLGIIFFFHDRGWHPGGALVAAMAFAFGGSASARIQHTSQIISLAYLPLALWILSRALERSSWRAGLAAGVICGLLAMGRDQVALLSRYVLAGFVLAHCMAGGQPLARLRASIKPLAAATVSASIIAAGPIIMTMLLA